MVSFFIRSVSLKSNGQSCIIQKLHYEGKKLKSSAEKEILRLALPATNTDTGIQFGHWKKGSPYPSLQLSASNAFWNLHTNGNLLGCCLQKDRREVKDKNKQLSAPLLPHRRHYSSPKNCSILIQDFSFLMPHTVQFPVSFQAYPKL